MVKLYLDENINILLASLLRSRNLTVTTALESNMLGKSDKDQLDYGIQIKAVLVTHNRADFENLFQEYIERGKSFPGIIILIRRDVYRMAQLLSRFVLTP
ncbi:MAG: DUF5615 family PIN-like protein [Ignavibacteriae bacterium]|nr:DUF5615 family PIN-like protein [Ignavibacteriota bacterium]